MLVGHHHMLRRSHPWRRTDRSCTRSVAPRNSVYPDMEMCHCIFGDEPQVGPNVSIELCISSAN